MHRQSIITLLFWGMVGLASAQSPPRFTGIDDPAAFESQRKALAAKAWLTSANRYGDHRIDVEFYDFSFDIRYESRHVSAVVRVRFRLQDPAASVSFQLTDSLEVGSVAFAGNGPLPFSRPGDNTVELLPEGGFGAGAHEVVFAYEGTPPNSGMGSFVFDESRGFPTVWTLSEPFGASDWFPTNNLPGDKIDSVRTSVTVPKPLVVASNGLLQATEDLGSDRTYVWETKYPIAPYLISLAIAPYEEFTLWHHTTDGDSIPIVNYVYPRQNLQDLKTQAQQTLGLMSLYSELYGPYPFAEEKYGHAQFGRGGGMEHQTISSMFNLNYFLVAHELAHQWLGDAVTGRTWQDLWIQEGFASLSEGMALEHHLSEDDFRSWLSVRRGLVTAQPDGSVYIPQEAIDSGDVARMFSTRLTYQKAAWVLHMLRRRLGDEAFFGAVRNYISGERQYGAADTEDFRRTMEQAYGASLQRFFDDWVYGEGFPVLRVETRPVPGQTTVQVVVEQTGSANPTEVFEFPLEVVFRRAVGDTLVTLPVSERLHEFYVDPGPSWYAADIDPNVNLLFSGSISTALGETDAPELPFAFEAPYPNPFNPLVTVPVQLQEAGYLTVEVIDAKGAKVAEMYRGHSAAGRLMLRWDAHVHAAGVYFVRATMGARQIVVPVTLLK